MARLRLERAIEKAAPLLVTPEGGAAATIGNEDVHDLRVSLRRLRSWLRAAHDLLDPIVPSTDRAALRRLARRAGAARDAQVQWKWLTAPDEPFSAPAARAAAWLAAHRHAVYVSEHTALQQRMSDRWPALSLAVAHALAAPSARGQAVGETLAQRLAPVLADHVKAARRALDRIEHRTQVSRMHRARIKVKRLRYLVDAVDSHSRSGRQFVGYLRELQDALGDAHDAHVMDEALAPLCVPRPRQQGEPRPPLRDLRALRAAVHRRELRAFRRSLDLASAPAADAFWREPARLAATLLQVRAVRQVADTSAHRSAASAPAHAPAHR